jgi:hypothetical protein
MAGAAGALMAVSSACRSRGGDPDGGATLLQLVLRQRGLGDASCVDGGGSGSRPDLDGSSDCIVVHPWAVGSACAEVGAAAPNLDGGDGGCLSLSLGAEVSCGPGSVGEANMGTPRYVSRGDGSRGLSSCGGRRGACACRLSAARGTVRVEAGAAAPDRVQRSVRCCSWPGHHTHCGWRCHGRCGARLMGMPERWLWEHDGGHFLPRAVTAAG